MTSCSQHVAFHLTELFIYLPSFLSFSLPHPPLSFSPSPSHPLLLHSSLSLLSSFSLPLSQENYKRWLCASKLTFVNSSGDADSNVSNISSSTFSSPSNDTFNLEGNVTRMRPCLSVCHDVLQICPYYLPSRFQPKPNGSEDFFQVIYGGYPAFDCPSEDDAC